MKNGDTNAAHNVTDNERLNDILSQRMGSSMLGFFNYYQFTQRETEILILIAVNGFSNREIAEQCVITEKTVKNHLANIMKKIGIRSARKLLSMLFNHVLYTHENHSANANRH